MAYAALHMFAEALLIGGESDMLLNHTTDKRKVQAAAKKRNPTARMANLKPHLVLSSRPRLQSGLVG
jgi:hypothetical protein